MTVVREKDMFKPEFNKDSIDYCEMFDHTNFFTPAEIHISEEDIYS
jgi:hypothetical protein